jgi:hypothetical protein
MVQLHRHVNAVHRVHGKVIGASLHVQAHAIEHGLEVYLLFLPKRAAKALLPGLRFLFDQVTKRGNRSSHGLPLLSAGRWGKAEIRKSKFETRERASVAQTSAFEVCGSYRAI